MYLYPSRVVCEGTFEIRITHENFDPLPAQIEEQVGQIWEQIKQRDPGIPDTRLFCAKSITANRDTIQIVCGPSSRKYLKGTTHQSLMHIEDRFMHRGISMLAITLTSDDYVVLGMREAATTYPLCRHAAPAGRLEVREGNPRNGVYTEYEQELAITRDEIRHMVCIGVVADMTYSSQSFEFIFLCRLSLDAEAVANRYHAMVRDKEYQELEIFPWNPRFIKNVVMREPRNFPPTGYTGLALALRHEFGTDAFPIAWEPTHTSYEEFTSFQQNMITNLLGSRKNLSPKK